MNNEQLKACPFCQKEVEFYWQEYHRYLGDCKGDEMGVGWLTHLDKTNIEKLSCSRVPTAYRFGGKSKEEAYQLTIQAWNTRADETRPAVQADGRERHIVEVEGHLNFEQYERLKAQCEESFGKGNVILLEGGAKYSGKTVAALPPIEAQPQGDDDIGNTSDGYHTFNELYEHRHSLFIALMRSHPELSWRANNHDDGSWLDGWFIAGMHLPAGDISYHLPISLWRDLDRYNIATSNRAPKWDGHTSNDVIKRIREFLPRKAAISAMPKQDDNLRLREKADYFETLSKGAMVETSEYRVRLCNALGWKIDKVYPGDHEIICAIEQALPPNKGER